MLASDTLASALEVLNRFQTLALTLCPVSTELDPQGLWVSFDERALPLDARSLVIERGLSELISIVSGLMQRTVQPLAVKVKHAEPPLTGQAHSPQPYVVQYASERNSMLFAHQDLIASLPQANN